jgi:hypothetical protein
MWDILIRFPMKSRSASYCLLMAFPDLSAAWIEGALLA